MKRTLNTTKLLVISSLIFLLAIIVYFIVLPEYYAQRYVNNVHTSARALQVGYTRLEKSPEHAIIDDPTITADQHRQEATLLKNLLQENRIELTNFSSAANNFRKLPYTGFTQRAKAAAILQQRAVIFADQSNDAFIQYELLISFLIGYNQAITSIEPYVSEFNNTSDLNVYAGQSSHMRDIAEKIRHAANTVDALTAPHEAHEFKAASIQSLRQLAEGFDTFAIGLEIPADSIIYQGALQIETADEQINTHNLSIYYRDIPSSRTIKNIQELREKISLVLS